MSDSTTTDTTKVDGDMIPTDSPIHLVSLNTAPVRVSALSPDGKWFAFSTEDKLKLYSLTVDGLNVTINKEWCVPF